MLVSANTPDSLKRQVSNVQQYLQAHPERVSDIAYTLSQRREHLSHRTFFVAREGHPAEVAPFSKVPKTTPDITMVFSGQGAQWAQMAMDLLEFDPAFREDITAMDNILRSLKHPPQWSIESELRKPAEASQINRAEFAQPLCTAIQIALVNALARTGIHPDAVVGHSSGEIAAAYATGAISMAEAMIVAYYRGFVTKEQKLVGGMAAIGLGSKTISSYLLDGVVVACQNSPISTTISGDLDQLRTVMESIKASNPDVLVRELKVDMAYHSRECLLCLALIL
jgi:acyl transferase domain-containing protein